MTQIAKKHRDKLDEFKDNVQNSYEYFQDNYNTFNNFKKFVFLSSLSQQALDNLALTMKPPIECNSCEAYVSRLRGEFSKQMPSIKISTGDGVDMQSIFLNQQVIDFLEGHMRYVINSQTQHVNTKYDIYTDMLTGGFSIAKVFTDYENDRSFLQGIKFKRVDDPLLCGFDPDAKLQDKSDGKFCYELIPITKEEFEAKYPNVDLKNIGFSSSLAGVRWSYTQHHEQKKILVCQYQEKQIKSKKLLLLSNNVVLFADEYDAYVKEYESRFSIVQLPKIIKERKIDVNEIHLYKFIEDQILEHTVTDYPNFSLIFFDGNSVEVRGSLHSNTDDDNMLGSAVRQYTRPYLWHARGVQQFKNFAFQSLANEFENMEQGKWIAPLEGIVEEYKDAYITPQLPKTMIYRQFMETDPDKTVNPPTIVQRAPIPPEIASAIQLSDNMMQAILGSYDAALGINNNELSGIAIVEAATQSNAAAMPYIVSFLTGLTSVANLILKLIPKYYTTPRTIPIINKEGKRDFIKINQGMQSFQYPDNALQVEVSAGANFSIQKDRQLKVIMGLMQILPNFATFMNQTGIPLLLENLEINGIDKIIAAFENWQKQQQQIAQQQGQQQPNPDVMKAQNDAMKLNLNAQELQQRKELDQARLALDQEEIQNERMKIMLDAKNKGDQNDIQVMKSQTERVGQAVDLALKGSQHEHNKRQDILKNVKEIQPPTFQMPDNEEEGAEDNF